MTTAQKLEVVGRAAIRNGAAARRYRNVAAHSLGEELIFLGFGLVVKADEFVHGAQLVAQTPAASAALAGVFI